MDLVVRDDTRVSTAWEGTLLAAVVGPTAAHVGLALRVASAHGARLIAVTAVAERACMLARVGHVPAVVPPLVAGGLLAGSRAYTCMYVVADEVHV
jgi:hypothetical protein